MADWMKRKKLMVIFAILIFVISSLFFFKRSFLLCPDMNCITIGEVSHYEVNDELKLIQQISQLYVRKSFARSGYLYDDEPEIQIKYLNTKNNSTSIYHIRHMKDGSVWVYESAIDYIMYRVEDPGDIFQK